MNNQNKSIAIWLFTCALIVFLMVVVGGLTRLTGSGLSIVKWKPVHGMIPPLNATEWDQEFSAYKTTPEYIKKNYGIGLNEFRSIFWWEYVHRLIGRVLGVIFIIPFAYFSLKRYFPVKEALQLLLIFSLGGLQGFVGWWMVKSGLESDPAVSHFRLAAHLSIALVIFSLLFGKGIKYYLPDAQNKPAADKKLKLYSNLLLFVIAVQIVFGAFTAGLDAGLTYNTWPLMDGRLVPAGIRLNLSNIEFIQFFHRWWAFIVLAVAIFFSRIQRKARAEFSDEKTYSRVRRAGIIIHSLIGIQIISGILNLIFVVPVVLASAHQIVAVLILANAVFIRRVI